MSEKSHEDYVLDVIAGLQAMAIDVCGERIAVVRDPEKEMIGSIIIPEEGKRKEPSGTIVAVGIGIPDMDISVTKGLEIGRQVMYTKYNPIDFFITLPDGQEVRLELMHVSDLYLKWRI